MAVSLPFSRDALAATPPGTLTKNYHIMNNIGTANHELAICPNERTKQHCLITIPVKREDSGKEEEEESRGWLSLCN